MKEISEESSLVTMPSVFDCYWFDGSNLSKAASRQSFGRTGHRRRIRGRHCQGNGLYPHVRGYQGTHMACQSQSNIARKASRQNAQAFKSLLRAPRMAMAIEKQSVGIYLQMG